MIDGFGPALDGHFDVEDQLSRYLQGRAGTALSRERARLAAVDSRDAAAEHRRRVREALRERVGGLPEATRPRDVETTGRRQRDGYTVELLVLETHRNVHATANCYVPDGDGPHPAVLFLCGHTSRAKADPETQRACAALADSGVAVLAVDPIGQAEREQYADVDVAGTVSGGGGTFPHCYAGQKCFYAGANLARYMIHDDRCALSHLLGREDVDADRVAVAGTSGGGTQALYLAALDDRVDAAAVCCAVSGRDEQLPTGARTHAEQALTGSIPDGLGHDALLAAVAPRPVCVGAAASDRYFPIEGVHGTVDRARRVYDCYDAADRLTLTVTDAPHCSVHEFGRGVLGWLCERLDADAFEPADSQPLDPTALQATPAGSVLDAYPGERTIDDLIASYVAERHPDAGTTPSEDVDAEELRRTLRQRFCAPRDDCERHPRYVARTGVDGLDVTRVWFRTERNPDAVVAGVLASAPDSSTDSPVVVCYERGTRALPERSDAVASLAREHGAAFVFDPRGVGAVRNREILVPNWADDYDGVYGTEFKLANDALLLGDSLFGMRVADVRHAASFLRAETGADRVSFVGDGVGAYHALYAAGVVRGVDRVDLRDLGPSFAELATERDAPFDPRLTAFDVIGACDVHRVLAALEQRGVTVAVRSRRR